MDTPGAAEPEISVVIVNWNGEALLRACLGPLMVPGIQVVVVDNGSTDGSRSMLAQDFPSVLVVANQTNVGFARGSNQGLALATADAVLFLNNDTVPIAKAVMDLAAFLREHPDVGVVGPTLINVDGSPQGSCGPGPNLWTEFLAKTLLHRLVPRQRIRAPQRSQSVDWVTGAALCIRRSLAGALGGFDEAMFMFYEDLELCARVREQGMEVWFVATRPIVHLGGATRRRVEAVSLIHSYRSADRFFSRHGPRWRYRLLRALTVPEAVLRSAVWAVLGVTPSRRDLARERLRAYSKILKLATKGQAGGLPEGRTGPSPASLGDPPLGGGPAHLSLSVALCTFNGARFLPAQLASIAAQTRLPEELVVCDDASTDGTPEMLRQFAAAAPFPVRVEVNAQNLGFVRNFEQAIGLCQGALIALCDQDDVWDPEKLARTSEVLESRPEVGLVFTDADVVDDALRPLGTRLQDHHVSPADLALVDQGLAAQVLIRRTLVTGTTMMFRARFMPEILPIPAHWVHDAWISFVVAVRARLVFLPQPLVHYRQHGGNQIGVPKGGLGPGVRAIRSNRAAYRAEVERWASARQRVAAMAAAADDALDVPQRTALLADLLRKEEHMRFRADLPSARLARALPVARELARGRYRRYSAGARSALKDLVT